MKSKKKTIIIVVFIIAIILGILLTFMYQKSYSGVNYYTKITTEGRRIKIPLENNQSLVDYQYNQTAYDDLGQAKQVEFNANKDRPLKLNSYLQLVYNEEKGVVSWQEVNFDQLPEAVQPLLK